jgi:sialate O-acetylesterase
VFLAPLRAGGPYDMTITGTNKITVKDILIGEVWVGSGQSNMEFGMSKVMNADEEIAQAKYPQIRLFTVKRAVSDQPKEDVEGEWAACTPETVKNFSAVAYFFGRELHKTQHVPVGLIHSSWGGTPAQSWTEHGFLESDPALQVFLTDWQKALASTKPPGRQNSPAGLYDAMIAPLTPYAIRGVIWYQGESNANPAQAYLYRRLFPAMIESWRQAWGQGSLPFYFVQLANYRTNGWWPLLRESQTKTLELKNTGMALAIDVGNPTDIHPTNKQDVGHRLALSARALTYGEKIVYSGPMYRQMTLQGSEARLWFDSVGGGLITKGDGKLTGFFIAGPDHKFVPAEATIAGENVLVKSAEVSEPAAVRYAWSDDPAANLYNRAGLPAIPFRTDTWPEVNALDH